MNSNKVVILFCPSKCRNDSEEQILNSQGFLLKKMHNKTQTYDVKIYNGYNFNRDRWSPIQFALHTLLSDRLNHVPEKIIIICSQLNNIGKNTKQVINFLKECQIFAMDFFTRVIFYSVKELLKVDVLNWLCFDFVKPACKNLQSNYIKRKAKRRKERRALLKLGHFEAREKFYSTSFNVLTNQLLNVRRHLLNNVGLTIYLFSLGTNNYHILELFIIKLIGKHQFEQEFLGKNCRISDMEQNYFLYKKAQLNMGRIIEEIRSLGKMMNISAKDLSKELSKFFAPFYRKKFINYTNQVNQVNQVK